MLNKLSLKARLILLTAIAVLLVVIVAAVGLTGIGTLNKALEDIYKENMVPAMLLEGIYSDINSTRSELLLALQHYPDSPFLDLHNHLVQQHIDAVERNRERILRTWVQLETQTFTAKISS